MFPLHDGWSVAHLLGHEAFLYLGAAMNENLKINTKYADLEKIEPHDGMFIGNEFQGSHELEVKLCIHSTVIFQSSLEAWINFAYSKDPLKSMPKKVDGDKGKRERNFIEKWEHALCKIQSDFDFSVYTNFYRKYRNAIVHPTNKTRFEQIQNLNSIKVYEALKNAYSAMAQISAGTGQKFDDNHWEIICRTNNVPYLNFEKLRDSNENYQFVLSKYHDFFNNRNES